jgi:hypothetical protein
MDTSNGQPTGTPPAGTLRREIIVALSIKVLLLFGLWLLIFRSGGDTPRPAADIGGRLFATPPKNRLPDQHGSLRFDPNFVRPLTQEVPHVQ